MQITFSRTSQVQSSSNKVLRIGAKPQFQAAVRLREQMNRTRFMMIGALALAAGFLASVFVYRNLALKNGGSVDPGVEVMVAANDLQVGARVEQRDIKIIRIPNADMPPGAPRRKADVIGHGVIIPISKGEFILPNRLAGENAGAGLPSLIPPGMRAVSVRVTEVVSVAGFVTPGTRVDVLLTGAPSGSGPANDHGIAECRSARFGTHPGAHLDRRSAKYRGHHSFGHSR